MDLSSASAERQFLPTTRSLKPIGIVYLGNMGKGSAAFLKKALELR